MAGRTCSSKSGKAGKPVGKGKPMMKPPMPGMQAMPMAPAAKPKPPRSTKKRKK